MSTGELACQWAEHFGLALVPLFEADETTSPDAHSVLLDGGFGSFALSISKDALWRDPVTAAWAWSSNLPHHVTVNDEVVAVRRWDRPKAEEFSRASVEGQIEPFYAYLAADRVRSTQRVVDHVLQLFRRMRSLVAEADIPDERSIDAFLEFLDALITFRQTSKVGSSKRAERTSGQDLLKELPSAALEALFDSVDVKRSPQPFQLYPSLAVRHAGSEIFQEAHFELIRAPGLDLFGYAGPAEAKEITRGGAHFTPAPLARSVVEQTLLEVESLHARTRLTIVDPSCGSGAFLQEAARTLRRFHYDGEIRLIGRDISAAAVSMARFIVSHAARDWTPTGGISIDIAVADSLNDPLPQADVVLMNPPFIAWSALNEEQREQMKQVLGPSLQGRGDFSMAFVTRALSLLREGGALGVLLPASLLTLQAAESWRNDLLDRADLRFLASLGDYGLFAHALVQVAAAVLVRPERGSKRAGVTRALVSANSADATGNALRVLRRAPKAMQEVSADGSWRIFEVPTATIVGRPTWRLTSPRTESALARLVDCGAVRMSDLFEVRQGVRTGDNKAFLLTTAAFKELPSRERKYFRGALMNSSIQDGIVKEQFWIFYPYGDPKLAVQDEKTLKEVLPVYYKRYLSPRRSALASRASLGQREHSGWWDLSRSRVSWALDRRPRLVSKYFGSTGGFAPDLEAAFIVVQGFAWLPRWMTTGGIDEEEVQALSNSDLLCAYSALMNSRRFGQLLELFSPHVSGGQFDLSPRYVDHIPVPNLVDLTRDSRAGRLIAKLAGLGREPRVTDMDWQTATDRITAELYGGDFFDEV